MSNPDNFVMTHRCLVLHVGGNPVACILDGENESRYGSLKDCSDLKAGLVGFLNKHDDLGLLMGFKLQMRTETELFEYTAYPDDGFVDAVIFGESIHIINDRLENLFSLRGIVTDQFVKTRSEFEKFKKVGA